MLILYVKPLFWKSDFSVNVDKNISRIDILADKQEQIITDTKKINVIFRVAAGLYAKFLFEILHRKPRNAYTL